MEMNQPSNFYYTFNLRFKIFSLGQRTWSYLVAPTARNSALFTLTNLTQTTSGDLGETISTGYLDAMKAKIVGINSAEQCETTPTFLFSFTVVVAI
jgi:hypothetical protein